MPFQKSDSAIVPFSEAERSRRSPPKAGYYSLPNTAHGVCHPPWAVHKLLQRFRYSLCRTPALCRTQALCCTNSIMQDRQHYVGPIALCRTPALCFTSSIMFFPRSVQSVGSHSFRHMRRARLLTQKVDDEASSAVRRGCTGVTAPATQHTRQSRKYTY